MKSLLELAAHVGGEIDGDATLQISGLAPLEEAAAGHLSFFANVAYAQEFAATRASAVLVASDTKRRSDITLLRVENPLVALAKISQLFFPRPTYSPGIRSGARVDEKAQVHATATVMAGATVEAGAVIHERAVLFPGVYVGEGAWVGQDSVLNPNVTISAGCQVGARCIIHAGTVIGSDGFGFAFDAATMSHLKIPQTGIVRIEDDVEIGACSTVDRAAMGETVVGRGAKIDNLVQIAHNVRIGPLSILCAQVGISGSSHLGTGVVLGGQVGIAGHLHLGDGVKIAAQAGVGHDVEPGKILGGSPAFEAGIWKRASVAVQQLPALLKEVRALKKRIEQLEQQEKP